MAALCAPPLGDGAEQQHRVGGVERGHGAERALDLTGAGLVLHRAQRQPEFEQVQRQRVGDRGDGVIAGIQIELVARVDGRRPGRVALEAEAVARVARGGVEQAGEVPLDLQPDHGRVAAAGVLGFEPAQHGPRGQRVRCAVAQVLVTHHPGGARLGAGQDLEGERIGHQDEVARAGDLLHAYAGLAEEVDRDGVAGVEHEGPGAEVHAVAQHRAERVRGERLGAGQPVRVREDESYEVGLSETGLDPLGDGGLLIAPQSVLGDERGTSDAVLGGDGAP